MTYAGRSELFEWTKGNVELKSIDASLEIAELYAAAEALKAS